MLFIVQENRLSLQLALSIQIFDEHLPFRRAFLAVGGNALVVNELRWIAIEEIITLKIHIARIVDVAAAKHKVVKKLTANETNHRAAGKK